MCCQAMRCDVKAQRVHASGVVAYTLQSHTERCAYQVLDGPIGGQRAAGSEKVKSLRLCEINFSNCRRTDFAEALKTVEQYIVLLCQIKECHTNRQKFL